MKYRLMMSSILFGLIGCSSIRYVTVDHGHIVTQNGQRVDIVGNPPMICHTADGKTYSGYFEYQDDDGTIVLDDFGRGTILIRTAVKCELRLDDSKGE